MSLLKLHPRIEEALRNPEHGTVIDGAFATQAFDTSAEMIDIAGADISSLNEDGVLNTEHNNPDKKDSATFDVIIGRIIFAKKIFAEPDCESERELTLWKELQVPFVYGAAELFDAEDHENAKAAAAIIKHYHKRGLPVIIRYSIEGSTLERRGQYLTKTVARRVAATIKPCNKSSYNYLVSEAAEKPQQLSIEKNENGISPYISVFEMEYNPQIEGPVESIRNALDELKELNKALTLGSYAGSPGTLEGGAALSVEQVDRKKRFMKSQILAAFRDWDHKGPFEEFLKHRLPDADQEFIGRFAGIAQQIRFAKKESSFDSLRKDESRSLSPLNSKTPTGAKMFKDKYVMPGEAEIVSGPFSGSKIKVLHVDKKNLYVMPFKAGDQSEVKVQKLNRDFEGSHFILISPPEELKVPNHVAGDKHTDLGLTKNFEQQELVHGLDLSSDTNRPVGATELRKGSGTTGWFRAANGKMAYVKPAVVFDTDSAKPENEHYLSTARREVVFYLIAKDFFGLGQYVPTTALFKHPQTEVEHSAMEQVPFATHVYIKSNGHESRDQLVQAGDKGDLDKLAIMDTIMGNSDRYRHNYMTSPNPPYVHLIDNALIFNYNNNYIPQYLSDYHHFKGDNIDTVNLHPDAINWLLSLDPFELGNQLSTLGVHQKNVNEAVSRLLSMLSEVVLNHLNISRVLFAYDKYADVKEVA
jgi:hypothetical protein